MGISAATGMLIAMRSNFNPFSASIGCRSVRSRHHRRSRFAVGMAVGGIIVGVTQLVSLQYDPNAVLMYALLVFFMVPMVLPSGLSSWRHR